MRRRGSAEFVLGLGQGDQQAALAACGAREQKLQCERGLAGTWTALHEMQSTAGEPAPENVVQSVDAGRGAIAAIAGGLRGGYRSGLAGTPLFCHSDLPGAIVQTA